MMNIIDNIIKNNDDCKVEVGMRFKVFREIIDRTREQLAAELDILESEIAAIEAGRIFPDITYLHYLYENYDLNINWILGKVGTMFTGKDPGKPGGIDAANTSTQPGDAHSKQYQELFELMEIPAVERSIMAALLEIKTLLKKQSREDNNKRE